MLSLAMLSLAAMECSTRPRAGDITRASLERRASCRSKKGIEPCWR